MTSFKDSVLQAIPPRVAMRLRAEKNRRNLFGLEAPARVLTSLVPKGRLAIDAGANAGLYSYWIAQAASRVHAFEPQPEVFRRLAASVPANVTAHNVALSDHEGTATLHIPPTSGGEASLRDLAVATVNVDVPLRTLDSFGFTDVGFLKIDVEGHEEHLLRGAHLLLADQHPLIFIELEERHNPGGLERVHTFLRNLGYRDAGYMLDGQVLPLEEFEFEKHQGDRPSTDAAYVNNFVFRH